MSTHLRCPRRARFLARIGIPLLILLTAGCSDSADETGEETGGDVTTTTADASSSASTTSVPALVDQTQVELVNEGRGCERVIGALPPQLV